LPAYVFPGDFPFRIPEGYKLGLKAKTVGIPIQPSHEDIVASHLLTKGGKRPDKAICEFWTNVQGFHLKCRAIPGSEGSHVVLCRVTAYHELSKNRVHILGEEKNGDLIAIVGYNYHNGKGDILWYQKDHGLYARYKDGYPPALSVVSFQEVHVAFEGDVPHSLLNEALRLRGYKKLHPKPVPDDTEDYIYAAGIPIEAVKL